MKDNDNPKESLLPSTTSEATGSFIPINNEPLWKRAGAALFYGVASLSIMLINKQVLTVYKFPSPLVIFK